jgi:5'(3')-deoxyribonucleotidase
MARIICDVDGVLANFVGGVAELIGRPLAPKQWGFIERELTPTEQKMVQLVLKRGAFWWGLDSIPCAGAGVAELRFRGHDVIFATAPWASCREWWYERVSWLERRMSAARAECVAIVRKELLEGDAFIDDRLENVEAWIAAHPDKHAYLFTASYNVGAAVLGHPRVHPFDWSEAKVGALSQRLAK